MKTLFRFEDTYGMCDIFMAANGSDYIDIQYASQDNFVCDNTYVNFGLSNGRCFDLKARKLSKLVEKGFKRIVFVFDVDDMFGVKTEHLKVTQVNRRLKNTIAIIKEKGYDVKLEFAVTVHAAETILLIQSLLRTAIVKEVETFVNSENTNKFADYLLCILSGVDNIKEIKNARGILDIERLLSQIEWYVDDFPKSVNMTIFDGLLSRDPFTKSYMSYEQFVELMKEVDLLYDKFKYKKLLFKINGFEVNTNMSMRELRDVVVRSKTKRAQHMVS